MGEERLAQQRERMIEENVQYATKNQEAVKAEGGGVAAVGGKRKTARPVAKNKSPDSAESAAPAPAKKAPEPDTPKKNKVIKSPADEIDPDELPSEAPNPPMLFAVVFGPATLFLTFWFLGSLNII